MDGKKVSMFERSADTILIADALNRAEGNITYEELSKVVGKDVQGEARPNLQSARRIQQNEQGRVWLTVRGEGLKLAKAEDGYSIAGASVKKINRESKRSTRAVQHLPITELGTEDKKRTLAAISMLGVVHVMTRNDSVKKLEKPCEGKVKELDFTETLSAFGG